MDCFTKKEVDNPKLPKLSNEVQRLKEMEGGFSAMCEVMERYNKEAIRENNYSAILEMLQDNVSVKKICKYLHVTEQDIEAAKSFMWTAL